nr:uncharacterized protein F58A4.6 [Onthophagus taurus]
MEIFMRIQQNGYKYGKYVINYAGLWEYNNISEVLLGIICCNKVKLKKNRIQAYIDGICLHYLLKELRYCPNYRKHYVDVCWNKSNRIIFQLIEPKLQIIDYNWNRRISFLVYERAELEHTLSWLSTLGGAFSALGDYYENFALVAGKISYNQLLLAVKMGDPTIAARCRLYFSLSLIQRQQYKMARQIIKREYDNAKQAVVVEGRLLKMCLGIWSKLQYEYRLNKENNKNLPSIKWKFENN